ncbi:MAG: PilZ domain-containing protein [Treponema sp.]|nr:PilZ domain-containing protein [Treponema sp.]
MAGVFEGESLLKDISITGCCIECTMQVDVSQNSQYKLEVIPEHAAKIGKFELMVEARWVRSGQDACEIGFSIVASPKGKLFERYVDYLTWRSSEI